MNSKRPFYFLIFLLAFLAFGALVGGGAMIISPSGELLRMPLSNLGSSPFRSFLIPGIILFLVLGLMPTIIIFALIKKPEKKFAEQFNFFRDMHWSWAYTIYIAFALIIWIQIEMVFLQTVHWLHTFYMFYSILIIFISLRPQVRSLFKK
jgi:hypothetical protein